MVPLPLSLKDRIGHVSRSPVYNIGNPEEQQLELHGFATLGVLIRYRRSVEYLCPNHVSKRVCDIRTSRFDLTFELSTRQLTTSSHKTSLQHRRQSGNPRAT